MGLYLNLIGMLQCFVHIINKLFESRKESEGQMKKKLCKTIVGILVAATVMGSVIMPTDIHQVKTVEAAPVQKPAKVKNLRATAKDLYPSKNVMKATIEWNKVKGASGYRLSAKSSDGDSEILFKGNKTKVKKSFEYGKEYTLTIQAYIKNGKKTIYGKKTVYQMSALGILKLDEKTCYANGTLTKLIVTLPIKDETLSISVDGGDELQMDYLMGKNHRFAVNLTEGKHIIRINSDFYEDYTYTLNAKKADLGPLGAELEIWDVSGDQVIAMRFLPEVYTSGAKSKIECTIDGNALTSAPYSLYEGVNGDGYYNQYVSLIKNNVSKGKHKIKISVPGYEDYEAEFEY